MTATIARTLILDVTVPGNPIPKGRPRVGRNGHTITPARTAAAEHRVGWLVKAALAGYGGPDGARYAVEVRFCERRQPGQEADADNCQKLIGDALNGVVWLDDTQVVEWHVWMERDASRPRTELRIFRLDGGAV